MVRRPIKRKGKCKKFECRFIGPLQVLKRLTPTTYRIEDLPSTRTRRRWRVLPAHVSQLRPYAVPLRIEDEPDYKNNWVDANGSSEEEPDQESQLAPISSQLANQIAADSALPVTDNQKMALPALLSLNLIPSHLLALDEYATARLG